MSKKLTYEFVKEKIEKEGYKLLSKTYKNNKNKLKVKCPKDHESKIRLSNFHYGQRCQECPSCAIDKRRHSYEHVKELIEKEGYTLLSETYKNNRKKLKVRCPENHVYETTYYSFKSGRRCPECAGNKKLTYEHIKEQIENEGYALLSKEYKNANNKLKVKCSKGHKYKVNWGHFQQGVRCLECSGSKKLTYEFVKEKIEKEGYKLLSDSYKDSRTKLKVKCPEGHEYSVKWNNFQIGQRCPECYAESSISKPEKEVLEYVKTLYGEVISNDRTQIANPETGFNLELDIWLPELNKAIEFNGRYWHSSYYTKRKDKIKKQQCEEKGIDLMIIDEEIWNLNKEKCLDKIRDFILV